MSQLTEYSTNIYFRTIFPITLLIILLYVIILVFIYPSSSDLSRTMATIGTSMNSFVANSVKKIPTPLNVKGNSY